MINNQHIDDNKCFKGCLVRYLHPTDHHPARVGKPEKILQEDLILEVQNFQLKLETIRKSKKKKNSIAIRVFRYENKEKYPIHLSKNAVKSMI